jgi:hypothetical protein
MVRALFMNMTVFVMRRNFIKCYIDSLLNLARGFLGNDTQIVWQVIAHASEERTASIFTGVTGDHNAQAHATYVLCPV